MSEAYSYKLDVSKTDLWRMARDYGAKPPAMKETTFLKFSSRSYGLYWAGCRAYLWAAVGQTHLYIDQEHSELPLEELQRRGMVKEIKKRYAYL